MVVDEPGTVVGAEPTVVDVTACPDVVEVPVVSLQAVTTSATAARSVRRRRITARLSAEQA